MGRERKGGARKNVGVRKGARVWSSHGTLLGTRSRSSEILVHLPQTGRKGSARPTTQVHRLGKDEARS